MTIASTSSPTSIFCASSLLSLSSPSTSAPKSTYAKSGPRSVTAPETSKPAPMFSRLLRGTSAGSSLSTPDATRSGARPAASGRRLRGAAGGRRESGSSSTGSRRDTTSWSTPGPMRSTIMPRTSSPGRNCLIKDLATTKRVFGPLPISTQTSLGLTFVTTPSTQSPTEMVVKGLPASGRVSQPGSGMDLARGFTCGAGSGHSSSLSSLK
mmetsp:Transcript_80806/g.254971  ORF Transcript_80806/g.254971 Transcript_80806/m.254971 type:complete len:210 (-) Transcript_80806:1123-1752(-)